MFTLTKEEAASLQVQIYLIHRYTMFNDSFPRSKEHLDFKAHKTRNSSLIQIALIKPATANECFTLKAILCSPDEVFFNLEATAQNMKQQNKSDMCSKTTEILKTDKTDILKTAVKITAYDAASVLIRETSQVM